MKALVLGEAHGGSVRRLVLPLPHIAGPFDLDVYRRRAAGEEPAREYIPITQMRTITLSGAPLNERVLAHLTGLIFVATGAVHIDGLERPVEIVPGDFVLLDPTTRPGKVSAEAGSRLIQFDLDGPVERNGRWAEPDPSVGPANRQPNFKQMRKGADGVSYFHDFDHLFPERRDRWTVARATIGLHLGDYADQEYMGLHPSGLNQLVLILTGCVELGVTGDGRAERFCAGDAVLAADRTGEGHTDLFIGRTALANVVISDDALWPAPA